MNDTAPSSPDQAIRFGTTHAASFRLKLSDLVAAQKRALETKQPMAFGIEFISASPPFRTPERYVVVTEADYHAIRHQRDMYAELAGQLGAALTAQEFNELIGVNLTGYDEEE